MPLASSARFFKSALRKEAKEAFLLRGRAAAVSSTETTLATGGADGVESCESAGVEASDRGVDSGKASGCGSRSD